MRILKKSITSANFNSKKELFENKTNQISSKKAFPIKKGSNILNNPIFANLAKMMGERISSPQIIPKNFTNKKDI